jgi:GT2 family glycosyltransferase
VTRVMMLSPEREFATAQAWQVVAPFVIQWSRSASYADPDPGVLSVSDILKDVEIDADNILSRRHDSGLEHLEERDRFWGESAKNVSRMSEVTPTTVADADADADADAGFSPDVTTSKTYRTGRTVLAPLRLIGIHRLMAASRRRREVRHATLLASPNVPDIPVPDVPVPEILVPDIRVALINLEHAVDPNTPLPDGDYFLFVEPTHRLQRDWYNRFAANCHESDLIYFVSARESSEPFSVTPAWSPTLVASGWNPLGDCFAIRRELLQAIREQPPRHEKDFAHLALRVAQTAVETRSDVRHVPFDICFPTEAPSRAKLEDGLPLVVTRSERESLPVPQRAENVSVIVPTAFVENGSGRVALESCLASLYASLRNGDEIVLSVSTTDAKNPHIELISSVAPCEVRVICDDEDFNFSRRVNLAVIDALNDFVLIVNDDVEMITSDALNRLVAHARQPDVAAVGVLLTFPDGTIQHAGHIYRGGAAYHVLHEQRPERYRDAFLLCDREVSGVTGACLMTRKTVWHDLGGMSNLFPLNFNDVDFCLKAGFAGYRIIQANSVRGEHNEHSTREGVVTQREYTRLLRRWSVALQHDRFTQYQPE